MVERSASFWAISLALGLILIASTSGYLRFSALRESVERGAQLFAGLQPGELHAQMAGHSDVLLAQATRCTNCHLATNNATGKTESATRFGPALTASHLLETRSRRGGPPSLYDEDSFCRVLKVGIDPASVVIDQAMPRYQASTAQCLDIWNFLVSSK